MAAPYVMQYDEARAVLDICVQGFWSRETLAAFGEELRSVMLSIDAAGRPFSVLVDANDFPVQSLGVTLGYVGVIQRLGRKLWVPTAVVTTRALVRLQALRTLVFPHIRIFPDEAAAVAWLADRQDRRRAA